MRRFRFRLATRVYSGFAVLLAFAVGLAVLGSFGLTSIESSVDRMSALSENTIRALQIAKEVEVMRRAALQFKADRTEAAVQQGNEAAARAVSLLQAAAATTVTEQRRDIYVKAEKAIGEFQARREDLVALGKEITADRARLDAAGTELTAVMTRITDAVRRVDDQALALTVADLEKSMQSVRAAIWWFVATLDPKGSERFKASIQAAYESIAVMEQSDLPDEAMSALGPVNATLAIYAASFEHVASTAAQSDKLFGGEMVPRIEAIQDAVATAQASLTADFAAARSASDATVASTITVQQVTVAAALLLGGLLAAVIGRGIARPIRRITDVLRELAGGNTSVPVPYTDRRDEVGDNARAAQTFKENLLRLQAMEAEQKAIRQRAAEERKAAMHELAGEFEAAIGEIVDRVSTASTELEAAARCLTRTAETTQSLSATVASASELASTNVHAVAAAATEMTSSVNEIGRQVQASSRIAAEAVRQAGKTDGRIGDLSQAANRIGDVVKLITAIAEQTNLLALNATIEAARAGESGKGFAVVASEVKALAAQTAKATGDIATQISGMQAATRDSVADIKEIGGTIGEIAEIAAAIAAAVEEQGAATAEIARNVQQAAQGTGDVAVNIADVERGAGETGSASAQVLSAAQSLAGESSRLEREVARFLATVRAA